MLIVKKHIVIIVHSNLQQEASNLFSLTMHAVVLLTFDSISPAMRDCICMPLYLSICMSACVCVFILRVCDSISLPSSPFLSQYIPYFYSLRNYLTLCLSLSLCVSASLYLSVSLCHSVSLSLSTVCVYLFLSLGLPLSV